MNSILETLNQAGDVWWTGVLHATWQSTLVAVIFLAAVYVGRRLPAQIRYAILLVALAKFAVPAMLSAPSGLFTQLGPVVATESKAAASNEAIAAAGQSPLNQRSAWAAGLQWPKRLTWRAWLLLLHVLGALATAGWFVVQLAKVARLLRRARAVTEGSLYDSFAKLSRKMGVRRPVRLLISLRPSSPIALGVLRPAVIIPTCLLRDLPAQQVDTILAHELAHHRRGDLWVNWLQILLAVVWWFNPVIWLLNRVIRQAREDCCDDLLLSRQLTTGSTYCDALLQVASRLRHSAMLGAPPGFAERLHPLGERFKRIMDSKLHHSRRIWLVTVPLVIILAVLVLPGLRSEAIAVQQISSDGPFAAAGSEPGGSRGTVELADRLPGRASNSVAALSAKISGPDKVDAAATAKALAAARPAAGKAHRGRKDGRTLSYPGPYGNANVALLSPPNAPAWVSIDPSSLSARRHRGQTSDWQVSSRLALGSLAAGLGDGRRPSLLSTQQLPQSIWPGRMPVVKHNVSAGGWFSGRQRSASSIQQPARGVRRGRLFLPAPEFDISVASVDAPSQNASGRPLESSIQQSAQQPTLPVQGPHLRVETLDLNVLPDRDMPGRETQTRMLQGGQGAGDLMTVLGTDFVSDGILDLPGMLATSGVQYSKPRFRLDSSPLLPEAFRNQSALRLNSLEFVLEPHAGYVGITAGSVRITNTLNVAAAGTPLAGVLINDPLMSVPLYLEDLTVIASNEADELFVFSNAVSTREDLPLLFEGPIPESVEILPLPLYSGHSISLEDRLVSLAGQPDETLSLMRIYPNEVVLNPINFAVPIYGQFEVIPVTGAYPSRILLGEGNFIMPIPEPGAAMLLAVGACLSLLRRRRLKRG